MNGIHNILKAAFDQLLLKKKKKILVEKNVRNIRLISINSKSFNKKIEDFYKDKLKSELCRIKQNNSGILRFYSNIFCDFELQRYLKLNISKDNI